MKPLVIFLGGIVFIFGMSVLVAVIDLATNPWLKTSITDTSDLGLISRPALLYYYLPAKFWLQTILFSIFGSLWVTLTKLDRLQRQQKR